MRGEDREFVARRMRINREQMRRSRFPVGCLGRRATNRNLPPVGHAEECRARVEGHMRGHKDERRIRAKHRIRDNMGERLAKRRRDEASGIQRGEST